MVAVYEQRASGLRRGQRVGPRGDWTLMRPLRGGPPGQTWLAMRRSVGVARPALEAVRIIGKRDCAELPAMREAAAALEAIDEPGVLTVRAVAWDEDRSELVVAHDWIEGVSLGEILAQRRHVERRAPGWGVVAQLGVSLARSLAARHRARPNGALVLDELVASTVLIDVAGRPWMTTIGYPEHVGARVAGELASVPRDISMLCAKLYECATLERADAEAYRQERPADGFSADLWRVVLRGLHPDPSRRWSSAAALAQAIDGLTPANVVRASTLMLRQYVRRCGVEAPSVFATPVVARVAGGRHDSGGT